MSDNEAFIGGGSDDDLSLPRATVMKLVSENMPAGFTCSKDMSALFISCCVEFINLVTSEANEICEKGSKKTIAAEHIIEALQSLEFKDYVEQLEEVGKDFKQTAKDRTEKRGAKLDKLGLTTEELQAQQELLFAKSRALVEGSTTAEVSAAPTAES